MDKPLPKIGVGIIVRNGDKILLQKRIGSHGENTWSLPGGHLEWNETLKDCACREVREETGVEVGEIEFYAITNDIMKEENRHYITIFLEAKYLKGEPQIMENHRMKEIGWFKANDLPNPLFLPLKNLVEGKSYPVKQWGGKI